MKDQTREDPKILAAAERQMQAWSMTEELAERAVRKELPHRVRGAVGPYIAISREAGAGGSTIARIVGETLGWEVLDKNLLDQVASRYHLPKEMLELVDETSSDWAFDILGTWLDRRIVSHDKYVAHLTRCLLAAARRGNVIFVGRGAQFLLPQTEGLSVRLIASRKYRIAWMMQHEGLDEAAARRRTDELDRGRREFVARYFHHDIDDPHLYDMVLNVERMGTQSAAEKIARAFSER